MDKDLKQKAAKRINTVRALNGDPIPPMGGRPIRPDGREGFINRDDITNLSILLNTCKNWEEFLFMC